MRRGGAWSPVSRPLPDVLVRSLATSKDVRLAGALAGRPAVLLLTDGSGPPACPVGRAAADLQRDYAPWFSWVAVLSGPFTVSDLESVRGASPVRFERLYLDRAGAVRAALGIARLPALLLVDEDGAVHEICSPDGSTAALRGGRAESSRPSLPGRDAGAPVSRISGSRRSAGRAWSHSSTSPGATARWSRSSTAGCLPCARQLEVLDFARDRHAGRVNLVTVFLDDAADTRIRGFLGAAGVTPDHILRDPELRLAGRYGIDAVPALLVIDAAGSDRPLAKRVPRGGAGRALQAILNSPSPTGRALAEAADPSVREARRMHAEACAFLREGKPEYALLYQERIREMLPGYHSVNLRIAEAALAAGRRDLALRSLARYLAARAPDLRQLAGPGDDRRPARPQP